MKSFQVADFNAPLKEVDQPTPQPPGTQVLIKVKAAGVCHSDLHIWEGGYDLGHGRKPLSLKDRGVSLPRTMGHETVGEIVAFGPDVTAADKGDLKVGDVALVYPWLGCGKCETCLGRRREHVPGQAEFARRLLRRRLCRPHDGAASEISAQSERARSRHRGALCLLRRHHLQRAEEGRDPSFDTPIVIFGAGGLGLMALSLLKAMGGKGAIVVDIDAQASARRRKPPARSRPSTARRRMRWSNWRRRPAGRSAR